MTALAEARHTSPLHRAANIGQMREIADMHRTNKKRHGSDATMENGIFEGLKVLDCASFIAAPAAATVLSDFGAEVIKIEPPGHGRSLPQPAEFAGISRQSAQFRVDAGVPQQEEASRSTSRKPEGQAVLHRLAAEADVFITNFPPAVRARLGMTYDATGAAQRRG